MRNSAPCKGGSLAVWEVVRAPKRFHALFSASWRRYLYLFPLQQGAIKRSWFIVLNNYSAATFWHVNRWSPIVKGKFRRNNYLSTTVECNSDRQVSSSPLYAQQCTIGSFNNSVDVDVAFVDRCLQSLEGLSLPYNGFAFGDDRGTEDAASDVCTLFRASAFFVDLGT